jgi:hypothetical protein
MNGGIVLSRRRRGREGTLRAMLIWAGVFLMAVTMTAQAADDDPTSGDPTYMPQHCTDVVNGLKGGTYFKIDFNTEWRAFMREIGEHDISAVLSKADSKAWLKYKLQHGTKVAQVDADKLKPLQSLLTNSDNFCHGPMSVVDYDAAAISGTEGGKSVVITFGYHGVCVCEDGKWLYSGVLNEGPTNQLHDWENEIGGQN